MKEYLFGAAALLLLGGIVVDVWIGRTLKRRRLLQGSLVVLALITALLMPTGSSDGDDHERPDPPYTF